MVVLMRRAAAVLMVCMSATALRLQMSGETRRTTARTTPPTALPATPATAAAAESSHSPVAPSHGSNREHARSSQPGDAGLQLGLGEWF